jgi:hypothetical protein
MIMLNSPDLSLIMPKTQFLACIQISPLALTDLTRLFFQKFWNEIHNDIFTSALSWFETSSLHMELNATNIVLAPKIDTPQTMKDLRSISLCNVLYKVISKVLAIRLRPLINKWISPEQAAFVHSRSITGNALTAFETLHHMRCKRKGKIGEVALKLDISKAFDSVSWSYLEAILTKMGFHAKWISWMMMCITSVEYHVILNGDRIGPITPQRGLRQGCPLSPYLYNLCAEGLSSIIKNYELHGKLHGSRVCRTAPRVSHLLFVDDSFLFCNATILETQSLKEILSYYELASGQGINYGKSAIAFSANTDSAVITNISSHLGVSNTVGSRKFLGLPSMVGVARRQSFLLLRTVFGKNVKHGVLDLFYVPVRKY